MRRNVLLDTGPLVAFIDRGDRRHDWSLRQWKDVEPPLRTCESVISETCFRLQNLVFGAETVLELLGRNVVQVDFEFRESERRVGTLLRKYSNVPMSVAAAGLVGMAAQRPHGVLLTLDTDFTIYGKHGRQTIPLLCPARE